jgi:hypothetical protein
MKKIYLLTIIMLISFISFSQTISLIGSATPAANWYIDFNMTQDLQNPLVWTINITLTDGEVKFRQDAAWDVSWGGTDFPSGNGIPGGPNIPVTAGNYDVVLNTGEPYYEFILNTSYGNVGINNDNPQEKLDVNGNIRFSGELKPNGVSGTTGQMLKSNGDGTMGWAEASTTSGGGNTTSASGGVGFGTWGGCDMANVSEYNPVSDTGGILNSEFGKTVSISGDYAIVGAPDDDDANGIRQGSGALYKRDINSGIWEPYGPKLFNPDASVSDYFGYSVSISGDYIIIGAPFDDEATGSNQGSASIFKRNTVNGNWVPDGVKLLDPLAQSNDQFGSSVCISGEYAIIGAHRDDGTYTDQGSACIFKRNLSGIWEFEAKLIDSDYASGDYFGYSVSISGEYAIVGTPYDDASYPNQGSASIFRRNAYGVWEQQGSKLLLSSPGEWDKFGYSVSISGDNAIIGTPGRDLSVADEGAAFIYRRNPSNGIWQLRNTLSDQEAAISDGFGTNVNISGNYAIVAAESDDVGPQMDQGSAIIFVNTGFSFQRVQKINDPAGEAFDGYGISCSIDGSSKRFILGLPEGFSDYGKVVFGKVE